VQWPAAITNLRELPVRQKDPKCPDTPTMVTQLHVYPEVITTLPQHPPEQPLNKYTWQNIIFLFIDFENIMFWKIF